MVFVALWWVSFSETITQNCILSNHTEEPLQIQTSNETILSQHPYIWTIIHLYVGFLPLLNRTFWSKCSSIFIIFFFLIKLYLEMLLFYRKKNQFHFRAEEEEKCLCSHKTVHHLCVIISCDNQLIKRDKKKITRVHVNCNKIFIAHTKPTKDPVKRLFFV